MKRILLETKAEPIWMVPVKVTGKCLDQLRKMAASPADQASAPGTLLFQRQGAVLRLITGAGDQVSTDGAAC